MLPFRETEQAMRGRASSVIGYARGIMRAQGYAMIVPILSNAALLLFIFLIGRTLFGDRVGALAAVFTAAHPMLILCTHRVWADNTTAMLVAGSMAFYFLAVERRSLVLSALAGALAGGAALTKQSGLLPILVVAAFGLVRLVSMVRGRERLGWARELSLIAVFTGFMILVCGWWYGWIHTEYGSPLYSNVMTQPDVRNEWFETIGGRNKLLHLVNIPALSPVFALMWASFWARGPEERGVRRHRIIFLWLWIAILYYFIRETGEERYQLPSLGAMALLAAWTAERARIRMREKLGPGPGGILWGAVIAASLLFSCAIGLRFAWSRAALIPFPF